MAILKNRLIALFASMAALSSCQMLQPTLWQQKTNIAQQNSQKSVSRTLAQNREALLPSIYKLALNPFDVLQQGIRKDHDFGGNAKFSQISSLDDGKSHGIPEDFAENELDVLKSAVYTALALPEAYRIVDASMRLPLNFVNQLASNTAQALDLTLGSKGFGGLNQVAQSTLESFQKNPLAYNPAIVNGEIMTMHSFNPDSRQLEVLIAQAERLSGDLDRVLAAISGGRKTTLSIIVEDFQKSLIAVKNNPNDPTNWAVLIKQIDLVNTALNSFQSQWKFLDEKNNVKVAALEKQTADVFNRIVTTDATDPLNLGGALDGVLKESVSILTNLLSLNGSLFAPIIKLESDVYSTILPLLNFTLDLVFDQAIVQDLNSVFSTIPIATAELINQIFKIDLFSLNLLDPVNTLRTLLNSTISLLDFNNLIGAVLDTTTYGPAFLVNTVTNLTTLGTQLIGDVVNLLSISNLQTTISNVTGILSSILGNTLGILPNLATSLTDITNAVSSVTDMVSSTIGSVTENIASGAGDALNAVANSVTSPTDALADLSHLPGIGNVINGVGQLINNPTQRVNLASVDLNSQKGDVGILAPMTKLMSAVSNSVTLGLAETLDELGSVFTAPAISLTKELTNPKNLAALPNSLNALTGVLSDTKKVVENVVDIKDVQNKIEEYALATANAAMKTEESIQSAAKNIFDVLFAVTDLGLPLAPSSNIFSSLLSKTLDVLSVNPLVHISANKKRKLQGKEQRVSKNSEVTKEQQQALLTNSLRKYLNDKLPTLISEIGVYQNLKNDECTELYVKVAKNLKTQNINDITTLQGKVDEVCDESNALLMVSELNKLQNAQNLIKLSKNPESLKALYPSLNVVIQNFSNLLSKEKQLASGRAALHQTLVL